MMEQDLKPPQGQTDTLYQRTLHQKVMDQQPRRQLTTRQEHTQEHLAALLSY